MKKWMVLLASLTFWGCSSTPKIDKLSDSANATDEVTKLQQEMADTRDNDQADILSPQAWKEASYYTDQAKERLADNRDNAKTLYSVDKARAWMKKSKEHAGQVATAVPDLLQVRKEALEAGAPQFASDEFSNADSSFRQYARDRENSEFGITNDRRTTYRDNYIFAQTTAEQNRCLGDARQAIHSAKDRKAETLLPNEWVTALRSVKNAEGYIAANRNDRSGIDAACRVAVRDSKRLESLTQDAIAARDATPEQRALYLEKMKQRNRNLASVLDQQAFEAKYDEARNMFTADEAEVYKQGNRLLIRMKGIEFPVGRASLPSDSFPLISKVGGVIKSFGDSPQVRIEGHTDSSGSAMVNQRLSQQRGEAVKSYLISTVGLQPEQVTVVGVRDNRPLASNKTKDGRAQNRRVDVIIMPQIQDSPQIKQAQ